MTLKPAILDTAAIAAAIRTAMPGLVEVGTAQSFGRLNAETIRWPSAFVLALAESPGANLYQTDALVRQRVLARFGVVWAVRDIGDRIGSIAQGEIRAVRSAGLVAVCQIRLPGADGPCEPVSGRLVSSIDRNGQMLWQDDFTISLPRNIPVPA